MPRFASRLRPYALHLFLLLYAPALLAADGLVHQPLVQPGLGVLTFAVLATCARRTASRDRFDVWLCVPVATLFEALGSLVWGGYTYRLENIPLYVPPGHALVFLFGLTAAGLPLVARHDRRFRLAVLGACTAWTAAGVTVLPLWTHRPDVQGLTMWPLFAWCVLRSGRGSLFAGIWIATATLDLAGTWAGAWTWAAVAPWSHLPSGNPPSAVAAGYAIIDGSVALLAPAVRRALARGRAAIARRVSAPAGYPASRSSACTFAAARRFLPPCLAA
ncbi:MAG TPA: hypothetical protein VFB26_05130 [Gaiellaceae bacterium]|nr:hypothetical protein [Gaiellaceae bacterium]